jgi:hypothetical protein
LSVIASSRGYNACASDRARHLGPRAESTGEPRQRPYGYLRPVSSWLSSTCPVQRMGLRSNQTARSQQHQLTRQTEADEMPVSFQSAARCRRVSSHHRGIPAVTPIGCYSCLVPRRREGRPVFVWHCKLLPRARYLPVGDVVAGSPVFLCRLLLLLHSIILRGCTSAPCHICPKKRSTWGLRQTPPEPPMARVRELINISHMPVHRPGHPLRPARSD